MANLSRKQGRLRRHMSIRNRVSGTESKPRLCVWKSTRHIRVQMIDDTTGQTVVAASTDEKDLRETGIRANIKGGETIGKLMAERALAKDIKTVVFDRGGFRYHGIVKSVADAAREGGLSF